MVFTKLRLWTLSRLLGVYLCSACAVNLFVEGFPRPKMPRKMLPRLAAEREGDMVYVKFIELARTQGASEALTFASKEMPAQFCMNFGNLKKAAAFLACQRQTSEPSGKGENHLDTLEDPELPLSVSGGMKLEVCSKCAKGSVKKGGFDPLSKLQGLAEELQMAVTPAGCFKQCKQGPNARLVQPDEESVVETFHGIDSEAAADRVVDSIKSVAKAGQEASKAPLTTGSGASQVAPRPSSSKDKEKRDRVRKSLESRVANILEGLPVRFAGEDLL